VRYIPVFPSLVVYERKDAKVPFISRVSLAIGQTLKIIAAVKTAVEMTEMSHLVNVIPLHVAMKTT
jgi:hypothetical protein